MTKNTVAADRKKFLDKMREQLLEMKAKLLGEMDSALRAEREGNKAIVREAPNNKRPTIVLRFMARHLTPHACRREHKSRSVG